MNLVALFLLAIAPGPTALKPVRGADLVAALNYQHELANTYDHRDSAYNVRVYEVATVISECGGQIASCPDVDLYIAVSESDLESEPALYRLPRAKGWQFVRWSTACPSVAGEIQVGLVVRTQLPDVGYIDPAESTKWVSTEYEVCVSPRSASFATKQHNHGLQPSGGASPSGTSRPSGGLRATCG